MRIRGPDYENQQNQNLQTENENPDYGNLEKSDSGNQENPDSGNWDLPYSGNLSL